MSEPDGKRVKGPLRWMFILLLWLSIGSSLWAAANGRFDEATYKLLWACILFFLVTDRGWTQP